MSDSNFDVIVVGVGGMGSAAAFELAKRGHRVLALEQFGLIHDLGSSHGRTRIIRKAYFEHPDYVPLVTRSASLWYDLEQRSGRHLLTECDCLIVGPAAGEVVNGVIRAATDHALGFEQLDEDEIRRRYPPLVFGEGYRGVLEHGAGVLSVEDCVRAHVDQARALGAVIRDGERVTGWRPTGEGVEVITERAAHHADRLVLTAGPWANRLLGDLGLPLTVMRQTMLWFGTQDDRLFRRDRFPIFFAEVPTGYFYGLPAMDPNGVKIARHYGAVELADVSAIDRTITPADESAAREFLSEHLPTADGPVRDAKVCVYTLTPDRHFVIDRHPEHPQVLIAAGFSGHGFKFAPAVAEVLADLTEQGTSGLPIGMFSAARFSGRP